MVSTPRSEGSTDDCNRPSRHSNKALADKAYDSNTLRELIADMGAEAVIPSNPTRKQKIPYDFEAYKVRNTIERCFNKLKH